MGNTVIWLHIIDSLYELLFKAKNQQSPPHNKPENPKHQHLLAKFKNIIKSKSKQHKKRCVRVLVTFRALSNNKQHVLTLLIRHR